MKIEALHMLQRDRRAYTMYKDKMQNEADTSFGKISDETLAFLYDEVKFSIERLDAIERDIYKLQIEK